MADVLLAVLLAVAAVAVSTGAWLFHPGAGLIVGGCLLAGWSVLVTGQIPDGEVDE